MADREQVRDLARHARAVYDRLGAGPRAILKRCRTADEIQSEGWFWRLLGESDADRAEGYWLSRLVACFPAANQHEDDTFSLGRHLRRRIYGDVKWDALPRRAVPFRRLLASRDRDDLAHQLRRLLLRASQPRDGGANVDWGVIGADMKFYGDAVRRRWASEFYSCGEFAVDVEDR